MTQLIDTTADFGENADGLFIRHSQDIPDDFLTALQDERYASAHARAGEMHRCASVPTSVVELWMRQGFDIFKATPREIVARLRRDDLGAFITTAKEV